MEVWKRHDLTETSVQNLLHRAIREKKFLVEGTWAEEKSEAAEKILVLSENPPPYGPWDLTYVVIVDPRLPEDFFKDFSG